MQNCHNAEKWFEFLKHTWIYIYSGMNIFEPFSKFLQIISFWWVVTRPDCIHFLKIISEIIILFVSAVNWIKKCKTYNESMSFGDSPGSTIPLHLSKIIIKKKKAHRTVVCQYSPVILHGPRVSFVPFQLSKPAEMRGAEGAAPRASTANGKCQPLSRARNHK